jgi:hypothetical protein
LSRRRPTRIVEPWKGKVRLGGDLTDYLCVVGSRAESRPSRSVFNCSSLVARIGEIKNTFEMLMENSEGNRRLDTYRRVTVER